MKIDAAVLIPVPLVVAGAVLAIWSGVEGYTLFTPVGIVAAIAGLGLVALALSSWDPGAARAGAGAVRMTPGRLMVWSVGVPVALMAASIAAGWLLNGTVSGVFAILAIVAGAIGGLAFTVGMIGLAVQMGIRSAKS